MQNSRQGQSYSRLRLRAVSVFFSRAHQSKNKVCDGIDVIKGKTGKRRFIETEIGGHRENGGIVSPMLLHSFGAYAECGGALTNAIRWMIALFSFQRQNANCIGESAAL